MTKTLLHIDASVAGDDSVTRKATAHIVADEQADTIIYRDLAADALPHVTGDWADARLVPATERTDAQHAVLAQSDSLVDELQRADTIVIGLPIYNFGMPANMKAWIDLIARPQLTFAYTENGPEGLLKGKKAIIAVASGGTPIDSPADFASTHLKFVLGFLGITDVTVMNARDAESITA